MKTILPAQINTVLEAQLFLSALYLNNESYHPEDSAHDIGHFYPNTNHFVRLFDPKEADHLNKLMQDIYDLPGNKGLYPNIAWDPCGYLLDIHEIHEGGKEILIMDDQPATCPKCSRRTEFTELLFNGKNYQMHTCKNEDCATENGEFTFIMCEK